MQNNARPDKIRNEQTESIRMGKYPKMFKGIR